MDPAAIAVPGKEGDLRPENSPPTIEHMWGSYLDANGVPRPRRDPTADVSRTEKEQIKRGRYERYITTFWQLDPFEETLLRQQP